MTHRNLWRVTFCTPSRELYKQPNGDSERYFGVIDVRAWTTAGSAKHYAQDMLRHHPALSHAWVWGYDRSGLYWSDMVENPDAG